MGAKVPVLYSVSRNAEDTEVTRPTKKGMGIITLPKPQCM